VPLEDLPERSGRLAGTVGAGPDPHRTQILQDEPIDGADLAMISSYDRMISMIDEIDRGL
jgi:hypothetical protein